MDLLRLGPIVAGQINLLNSKMIQQANHIPHQHFRSVRPYSHRFIGKVIAALIGNNDTVTGCDKRWNLVAPAVPEFREAM